MDERNLRKTTPGVIGPVDPEQGVQRRSTLVFFGDPAQVSEGFALALHAMGIGVSMADGIARDPSEQGE